MSGTDFFGHIGRFLQIKGDNTLTMRLAPAAKFDARADGFFVVDPTDATKRVRFDVSGQPTATDLTVTMPSAGGLLPVTHYTRIDAALSLVDDTSTQALFPAAQDSLTVQAGKTYAFEGLFKITKGANSVSMNGLFTGTGATFTTCNYVSISSAAASGTAAAANMNNHEAATTLVWQAATTSVNVRVFIAGEFEINAAGTVAPGVIFSGATGATPSVNVGSYFKVWDLGTNPITAIGSFS